MVLYVDHIFYLLVFSGTSGLDRSFVSKNFYVTYFFLKYLFYIFVKKKPGLLAPPKLIPYSFDQNERIARFLQIGD